MNTSTAMTLSPFKPDSEGVFFGLGAEEYHASPGVSQSTLKRFGEEATPAHFIESLTRKREPTPDMEFGTCCHTAILEPDKLADSFHLRPDKYPAKDGQKNWHGGSDWCKTWLWEHADKPILTSEQRDSIPKIVASVMKHTRFRDMLETGQREVSFFKRDEATGLLLKCRCDCVATDADGKTFIGDPKIVFRGGASREEFQRSVESFGYDIQESSYRFVTGASHFIFMCAEKEPPFESCEYELDGQYREGGLKKYRALLQRYANCVKSGEWPGYFDADVLSPSRWYGRNS